MTNLLEAGVDFLLIETCAQGQEAIAAAQVANELAPGHWGIAFSVSDETKSYINEQLDKNVIITMAFLKSSKVRKQLKRNLKGKNFRR